MAQTDRWPHLIYPPKAPESTPMIRLYNYVLSAECHAVQWLLRLLDLPFETIDVDMHPGLAHRSAAFISEVNPKGTLPVLIDGPDKLCTVPDILLHLARRYDAEQRWLPPAQQASVQAWLSHAEHLQDTVGALRWRAVMDADLSPSAQDLAAGHAALRTLDDHLCRERAAGLAWLTGPSPSIADIACFPLVALCGDAGLQLDDMPSLRLWMQGVRRLPGFMTMPGPPPKGRSSTRR